MDFAQQKREWKGGGLVRKREKGREETMGRREGGKVGGRIPEGRDE